ncbi:MAG: ABC transporter permease, partial [Pirellulales bacterium]
MLSYLVRRIAIGLLTLLLITFVIYALIRNIPGTPLTADPTMMDPSKQLSPAEIDRLNRLFGLDKPWYEAYFVWLGNVARLDFGKSISQNNAPVSRLIVERMPATLLLSITSMVLTYLLSIPIGLWATVHAGSLRERTVSSLLYMFYSLPAFVAALFLQLLFAVKLEWLPLFGMTSD